MDGGEGRAADWADSKAAINLIESLVNSSPGWKNTSKRQTMASSWSAMSPMIEGTLLTICVPSIHFRSSSTRIRSQRGRLSSVKERIFCSTPSSNTWKSSSSKPETSLSRSSFTVTVRTTIFDSTLIFCRNSRVCLDSCDRPLQQRRFVITKVEMVLFQAIYSPRTVNETPQNVSGVVPDVIRNQRQKTER